MMHKITIDSNRKLNKLGDLFGIFIEDLNHTADGGLYAEMVQNRAFGFDPIDHPEYHPLYGWEKIGDAELVIREEDPVSKKNPKYLEIKLNPSGKIQGVRNSGFGKGMYFKQGEKYLLSLYAKRDRELNKSVQITINGVVSKDLLLTGEWKYYEFELTAFSTQTNGDLVVTAAGGGSVFLDFVSLFPVDTYKGRKKGLRKDLACLLEDLSPKFMRFPGGCLVHDGQLDSNAHDSMYRWKNTIGKIENRPSRRNSWRYNQTLGLGFFEYFQLAEDIGAKPVPILPGAYDPHHQRRVPLDELHPWINDALDLIEFANGGVDTEWGRIRAEMGHPEPFNLEYIGIGNEEVGEGFAERYPAFHKAIKEKYPKIKIINSAGPFPEGGEYERGWKCAREYGSDIIDEHYYAAPEWFLSHIHRYDAFSGEGTKVFLGEYATWGSTLYNALAEAAYMTALQNASHAVAMACYAPLFCHADYINWKPDLIWFDNYRSYPTVNYMVQKLFMNHQGGIRLAHTVETDIKPVSVMNDDKRLTGLLYLSGNDSKAAFSNIEIRYNGTVTKFKDVLVEKGERYELMQIDTETYTISCDVKELEGFKGFNIVFGQRDENNRFNWLIGGWQNMDCSLEERIKGRGVCLSQYEFIVEKDRSYHLELKSCGNRLETYIDGTPYHHVDIPPVMAEPLYVAVNEGGVSDDVIIKAVNILDSTLNSTIVINGISNHEHRMKIHTVAGSKDDENSFENPNKVSIAKSEELFFGQTFKYVFPPNSVTVLIVDK